MLRLRLALSALACGFMVTLSGCASHCDDGRLFSRLFHHDGPGLFHSASRGHECECNGAHMPPIMDEATMPGAVWHPGASISNPNLPIPITNIPPSQTPNAFKVPNASPTPYSPTN